MIKKRNLILASVLLGILKVNYCLAVDELLKNFRAKDREARWEIRAKKRIKSPSWIYPLKPF